MLTVLARVLVVGLYVGHGYNRQAEENACEAWKSYSPALKRGVMMIIFIYKFYLNSSENLILDIFIKTVIKIFFISEPK